MIILKGNPALLLPNQTINVTNSSMNCYYKKFRFSSNETNFRFLQLLVKTRKEIFDNVEKQKRQFIYNKADLYKKNYGNILSCNNSEIYVYDLKAAYLNEFYKQKFLNYKTYLKLNGMYQRRQKLKVLKILGSIAIKKTTMKVQNYKIIDEFENDNRQGYLIWNFIENCIADFLAEYINENINDFIYSYCDEITFTKPIEFNKDLFTETKKIFKDNFIINPKTGSIKDYQNFF